MEVVGRVAAAATLDELCVLRDRERQFDFHFSLWMDTATIGHESLTSPDSSSRLA